MRDDVDTTPTTDGCAARALATVLEPVVGSVYFAPEAHAAYAELGFGPSPGPIDDGAWAHEHWGAVAMPDGVAYFASRGGLLGRARGEVVAAAFGVFNPAIVVAAVDAAWQIADPDDAVAARQRGAVAQLTRILGATPDGLERVVELLDRAVAPLSPAGRPMFAGLLGVGAPAGPLARMWYLADLLREYRGDAHVAAFRAAGFDGCQLQVLTERCAGMPPRTYAAGRGWDAGQLGGAETWLADRGLLVGDGVTDSGRAAREAVEAATDEQCRPMVAALGDEVAELVGRLQPWGDEIRRAGGYYPSSPQLATLHAAVDGWMTANRLAPLRAAT